jgi:hypothetical protein
MLIGTGCVAACRVTVQVQVVAGATKGKSFAGHVGAINFDLD